MKKIAFAFLIGDKINNENLWFEFFKEKNENYEIIIHSNKDKVNLKYLDKLTDKIYYNEVETKWGRLQKVQNFLMEKSMELNCDKIIYLSDSCLPVRNFKYILKFLNNNNTYISYSNAWDLTRFPDSIKNSINLYANQQWVIIDNKHFNIFLNSNLKEIFEDYVILPEESYYSTILGIEDKLNEIYNIKTTHIDWTRPTNNGNSPYLYTGTQEDIIDIIKIKEDMNILFIRKVIDNININFTLISE